MASPELALTRTEAISALLTRAASCSGLSQELQSEAQQLLTRPDVPWLWLKCLSAELSKATSEELWLHTACKGSQLVLQAPRRRDKSKELQARLLKLQENVDQASYNRMVSEVTKKERAAEALRSGALQTYKQQISFGLHVIVMMGTFYAVGHVAGTAMSPKTSVRAACGLTGMVLAMLVETVLLMLETSRFEQPKRAKTTKKPSTANPSSNQAVKEQQ